MKAKTKIVIKLFRCLNIIILFIYCPFLNAQNQFSKDQVLEDLTYLKESLEDAHYDLYAYTSKSEFDENYRAVRKSVKKDSFNLLEANSIFQRVTSKANNGHTTIDFPAKSYREYIFSGGTVFPLEIAFEDGKPLIRKNWSDNPDFNIGAEVLSINNVSMNHVLLKLYPLISAERSYFKNVKMELYSFPRLYWLAFGKQDSFKIEILYKGHKTSYSLKAINLLEDYEKKRVEVVNAQQKFKYIDNVAYLNPGNFSGDHSNYRHFIDSAFSEIKADHIKDLIIDLRNNGGGDDSFSDYLVSYIADKPFKWNSSFTLKTSEFLKKQVRANYDTTKKFWESVLTHENGEIYNYDFKEYQPQPTKKRYTGKVYVLVNRQSHSQAAVTAAQIQDYNFGTIVGEETGDFPSLYASIFQYALPNTEIVVHVSKGKIVRVNGSIKEEGVIPDIFIKDYLLDEDDEILRGILKRIEEKF